MNFFTLEPGPNDLAYVDCRDPGIIIAIHYSAKHLKGKIVPGPWKPSTN